MMFHLLRKKLQETFISNQGKQEYNGNYIYIRVPRPPKQKMSTKSIPEMKESTKSIPEIFIFKEGDMAQHPQVPTSILSIGSSQSDGAFLLGVNENNTATPPKIIKPALFKIPAIQHSQSSISSTLNQDDGDSSGRQSPLLTPKPKKHINLKKKIHLLSSRAGDFTGRNTPHGGGSCSGSQKMTSSGLGIANTMQHFFSAKLNLNSSTNFSQLQQLQQQYQQQNDQVAIIQQTPMDRLCSPKAALRIQQQVYGFRGLKRDKMIELPSLSGFYAYLAGLLLEGKQDIMLNIPETIIIHNQENLSLSKNASPKKQGASSRSPLNSQRITEDDRDSANGGNYIYLRNPQVMPSSGNMPSLPLVQKLTVEKSSTLSQAKHVLKHWLHDLNIKKIKQHADSRQGQEVYLPLSVAKRSTRKGVYYNVQSLDFFEESAYYRLKLQFAKGQDMIMQRYIPSKANKNSIVRVVWQRAENDKSPSNMLQGGFIKMYQISSNKQYDGINSQDKYTPKKMQTNVNKYLNQPQIYEVSPNAVKQNEYWDDQQDPDFIPEKALNAKYIQKLREKYSDQGDNYFNMSNLIKRPKSTYIQQILRIQDEIDQVKEFQYQYCTSDKHPDKNYFHEITPSSEISSKSEIYFQAEQLLRIINNYMKKIAANRRLSIACFDFIHDFTDRRWKFLNLKYFLSEEIPSAKQQAVPPSVDRELNIIRSLVGRGSPPRNDLEMQRLKASEVKSKCEGDYCNVYFENNLKLGNNNVLRSNTIQSIPFGYIRDAAKIIQFQQRILNQEFNISPDKQQTRISRSPTITEGSQDYFQVMRKVIILDRIRRKAITDGYLRDIEHFSMFHGEPEDKKLRIGEKDNIGKSIDRMNKLKAMHQELISSQNQDIGQFIQREHAKVLKQASNKIFDNVPVCSNCLKLYQFLTDVQNKLEDNIDKKDQESQRRRQNTIFLGLDPKLNDKVVAILRRQLDHLSKERRPQPQPHVPFARKKTISPIQNEQNFQSRESPSRFTSEEKNAMVLLSKLDMLNRGQIPPISRTTKDFNNHHKFSQTNTNRTSEFNSRPMSRERGKVFFSSTNNLDMSLVRDRDMIPDMPAQLPQQLSKIPSQTNLYLPPVTINDYICQQKKQERIQSVTEQQTRTLPPILQLPPKKDGRRKSKKSRQQNPQQLPYQEQNHIIQAETAATSVGFKKLLAIPLRSKSMNHQEQPKQIVRARSEQKKEPIFTKFHIKTYQPSVYDEIKKIIKNKGKKLKKKKKRHTENQKGLQIDPEMMNIVDKYNAIGRSDDEFSGPIEAIGSQEGHDQIQIEEQLNESSLEKSINIREHQLSSIKISGANNLNEDFRYSANQGDYYLHPNQTQEASPQMKMPPVQRSSLDYHMDPETLAAILQPKKINSTASHFGQQPGHHSGSEAHSCKQSQRMLTPAFSNLQVMQQPLHHGSNTNQQLNVSQTHHEHIEDFYGNNQRSLEYSIVSPERAMKMMVSGNHNNNNEQESFLELSQALEKYANRQGTLDQNEIDFFDENEDLDEVQQKLRQNHHKHCATNAPTE